MPDASAHIAAATHNLDIARHLLETPDYHDWCVIAIFYAALHMVEAVFAADPKSPRRHTTSHDMRDSALCDAAHLNHIFKPYSAIYRAAYVARYDCDKTTTKGVSCFTRFMPPHLVVDAIIGYRMAFIVQSAAAFLGPEDAARLTAAYKLLAESDAAKKYMPIIVTPAPPASQTPTV